MEGIKEINLDNLYEISIGAAVLGTGGGGNPRLGYLMAKKAIMENGPVKLLQVEELEKDITVGTVAGFGAPTITIERIPNTTEFDLAIESAEELYGKKIGALYPVEAGGSNSLVPVISAARRGIPLVDCDTMGRAFPKLEMVTFNVMNIKVHPVVMTNPRGECRILDGKNLEEIEVEARRITSELGGSSTVCFGLVGKEDLDKVAIKGIVNLAYKIGSVLVKSKDPFEDLKKECGAMELFSGKIVNIVRKNEGGFNRGFVHLEGIGSSKGKTYEVEIQNENIVAYEDKKVVCMVPDLLTLLDDKTAIPITTDGLKYGQRVRGIAFKGDSKWRSKRGLEIAGPKAFGLKEEFVPVEELGGRVDV